MERGQWGGHIPPQGAPHEDELTQGVSAPCPDCVDDRGHVLRGVSPGRTTSCLITVISLCLWAACCS